MILAALLLTLIGAFALLGYLEARDANRAVEDRTAERRLEAVRLARRARRRCRRRRIAAAR